MSKAYDCSLFSCIVLLILFIHSCNGDIGSAAKFGHPYTPSANACGFAVSDFPSSDMFGAAGEAIWDNGAACGRQYLMECVTAAPGTCVPGQTIQITILDRALTLSPQPSKEGSTMVLSSAAFQAIADTSAASISVNFRQA